MKCPIWAVRVSCMTGCGYEANDPTAVERAMKLRVWQLERSKLRATLAGCRVTLHEHLDQTLSITFGPHLVGRYTTDGQPAMEMTPPRKATKPVASHRGLEKSRPKAA